MKVFIFLIFLLTLKAGDKHQYAAIKWLKADSLKSGKVDLSALQTRNLNGTPVKILKQHLPSAEILMISYMAGWCKNCHYEAPLLNNLYKKYQPAGFEAVVIMEYSKLETAQSFVGRHQLDMPVYFGEIESKDESRRNLTKHYNIRRILADERGWGLPFSIIIDKNNFQKIGFIAGEFMFNELDLFLDTQLGEGRSR